MRSEAHFSLNKLFPTALFVVPRLFLCSVKFNNAESDSDKITGFTYFLISLSKVNPIVLDTHSWMASV